MANFWNALSAVGRYGVPAFQQAQLFAQQQQQQALDKEANTMRGDAIRAMVAPPPIRDAAGMPPGQMQAPMRPGMGAQPLPQQMEMPGAEPLPQNAPPRPDMAMSGQLPQAKIDWRTALDSIAKDHPGAAPEAIAKAVDKLTPFMTAQAQAEWRQIQMGFNERKLKLQETNTNADNTRADSRLALDEDKAKANIDYRTKRLQQFQEALASKPPPMEHMKPADKAKLEQLAKVFTQAENNRRTLEIGYTYATNKVEAAKKVEKAIAQAEAAQAAYEEFVNNLQGAAPAGASGAPSGGAAAPAAVTGGAQAPADAAPAPMATLAPPEPKPAGPVVKAAPNNLGGPPPGAAAPAAPAAPQLYPLPQSKTMMVKNRQYNVKGTPYMWDGSNLVKVQSAKAK